MDQSISSLAFKGSIPEAINEARNQKKLFVVYISGDDGDSDHLEQSTWMDSNVANSISKYCVFLHLLQGSVSASQFSAIYPQKSVPCITAIGYNGVQLWQHEGYTSPENLVASIEKAWASLHIQETAATFLTAALASNKSETSSSTSNASLSEERASLSCEQPSSLTNRPLPDSEIKSQPISELTGGDRVSEPQIKNVEASFPSVHANTFESGGDSEKPASSSQAATTSLQPVPVNLDNNEADTGCVDTGGGCNDSEKTSTLDDQGSQLSQASQKVVAKSVEHGVEDKRVGVLDSSADAYKTDDILLNIRLPDGASLREKFSATNTLRMVKDYVDKSQTVGTGSYDLAIPYPRKLFGQQDMSKSLSELGLSNRQALIVVPRNPANGPGGAQSVSRGQATNAANADQSQSQSQSQEMHVGYWGQVKKLISYINPLTYLSGSASSPSSEQGSPEGLWQYREGVWQFRPNSHIPNQPPETERPYRPYSPNASPNSENANKSRKPAPSRFGSNIHTLRHDEDDSSSNDRNTFWNGNSTQYGGNDNNK